MSAGASPRFDEVARWIDNAERPGFGRVSNADDVHVAASGRLVAFTGYAYSDGLTRSSSVVVVEAETGRTVFSTSGFEASMPRWSPTGGLDLSYVKRKDTVAELVVLPDPLQPQPEVLTSVVGDIQDVHWSPDGSRILLIVEDSIDEVEPSLRSWAPHGSVFDSATTRRCIVVDVDSRSWAVQTPLGFGVWEAVWLDDQTIAAIISEKPLEDMWYSAELVTSRVNDSEVRPLLKCDKQVSLPRPSPNGERVALIRARSSERGVPAGELLIVDVQTGEEAASRPGGVDVSELHWLSDSTLLFVGLIGLKVAGGRMDVASGEVEVMWTSDLSCGLDNPAMSFDKAGTGYAVFEGYDQYPALSSVKGASITPLVDFSHPGTARVAARCGRVRRHGWLAGDGLEIEGLLVTPDGPGPYPLVVNMHGGPAWEWRNRWGIANGHRYPFVHLLAERGYAVLCPNPRGSQGRGPEFAELAVGDLGGADALDVVEGINSLANAGMIDRERVGLTGISYGGYLAAMIPTLVPVAASVPVAAPTNWLSQHFAGEIPTCDEIYFGTSPAHDPMAFAARSPVLGVRADVCPTLNIAGLLDPCVPFSQAVEYDTAIRRVGGVSQLVIYPNQGHGISGFPETIDFIARMLHWFDRFLGDSETNKSGLKIGNSA